MTPEKLALALLEEDQATADVTCRALEKVLKDRGLLSRAKNDSSFSIVAKQDGVFSGNQWIDALLGVLGFEKIRALREGEAFKKNDVVLSAKSGAGSEFHKTLNVLSFERTLLNVLQQLCGVATKTSAFVKIIQTQAALRGVKAPQLLHTRKTLPLLRELQVQAVVAGGGRTHRLHLNDRVLLKENHKYLASTSGLSFRDLLSELLVEHPHALVEVESCDEFLLAQDEGVKYVMLDNFTPDEVKKAVQKKHHDCTIEVSGGIGLESIKDYVIEGVDRISVGALTHSVASIDLSLDWDRL